jgi:hypothetical protein
VESCPIAWPWEPTHVFQLVLVSVLALALAFVVEVNDAPGLQTAHGLCVTDCTFIVPSELLPNKMGFRFNNCRLAIIAAATIVSLSSPPARVPDVDTADANDDMLLHEDREESSWEEQEEEEEGSDDEAGELESLSSSS